MAVQYEAGNVKNVATAAMEPRGYHLNATISEVTPLTLTPPAGRDCRYVYFQVNGTNGVRYTLTPLSVPAADFGFVLATGGGELVRLDAGIEVNVIALGATEVLEWQFFE